MMTLTQRNLKTAMCLLVFPWMTYSGTAYGQKRRIHDLDMRSKAYNTAIGLRGGAISGFTAKQFLDSSNALEGILGVWPAGFHGTLLLEHHVRTRRSTWRWYYGGGGHVTTPARRIRYTSHDAVVYYDRDDFRMGIDCVLGIEYDFCSIPFALSLDVKPYGDVNRSGTMRLAIDPGIGIKGTF